VYSVTYYNGASQTFYFTHQIAALMNETRWLFRSQKAPS
jgi:hypothetical protein